MFDRSNVFRLEIVIKVCKVEWKFPDGVGRFVEDAATLHTQITKDN